MRPFRAKFGKLVKRFTGGSGEAGLASAKLSPANIGDITFVIFLLMIALISIAFLKWVSSDYVQFILAALWGLTIGGALLLYLPAKILITLIGGLLGVGASDLAGLAQVVAKMSTTVSSISTTINASGQVQIQQQPIWLFMVITALCCLPAYRSGTTS